jgi:hypothetical protein
MRGRFYYADQRLQDGAPPFREVRGRAHADFYYQLTTQGPWEATFVEGVGYMDFEGRVGALPSVEQ